MKKVALVFKFTVLMAIVALIMYAGHCMVTGQIEQYDQETGTEPPEPGI